MILSVMYLYAVLFAGHTMNTRLMAGLVFADILFMAMISSLIHGDEDPLFRFQMGEK